MKILQNALKINMTLKSVVNLTNYNEYFYFFFDF